VYQAFGNDTCIKCSIENGIKHTIVLTDDNVKIFDIKEDIHNNLEITMFYPDGSVFEDYEMGSKRPIDLFNYLIINIILRSHPTRGEWIETTRTFKHIIKRPMR